MGKLQDIKNKIDSVRNSMSYKNLKANLRDNGELIKRLAVADPRRVESAYLIAKHPYAFMATSMGIGKAIDVGAQHFGVYDKVKAFPQYAGQTLSDLRDRLDTVKTDLMGRVDAAREGLGEFIDNGGFKTASAEEELSYFIEKTAAANPFKKQPSLAARAAKTLGIGGGIAGAGIANGAHGLQVDMGGRSLGDVFDQYSRYAQQRSLPNILDDNVVSIRRSLQQPSNFHDWYSKNHTVSDALNNAIDYTTITTRNSADVLANSPYVARLKDTINNLGNITLADVEKALH